MIGKTRLTKRAQEELHWQAVRRYLAMWLRVQAEREKKSPAKEVKPDQQGELEL